MGWSNWKSKTRKRNWSRRDKYSWYPESKKQLALLARIHVSTRTALVLAIGSKFAESFWELCFFFNQAWNLHKCCHHGCAVDTAFAAKDVINNWRQVHFSPLFPFIISHCLSLAESNWSPVDKWVKNM